MNQSDVLDEIRSGVSERDREQRRDREPDFPPITTEEWNQLEAWLRWKYPLLAGRESWTNVQFIANAAKQQVVEAILSKRYRPRVGTNRSDVVR